MQAWLLKNTLRDSQDSRIPYEILKTKAEAKIVN